MDNYTSDTKDWLNERFKKVDENNIYFAHQPIYGFRDKHSESGQLLRYNITYQIIKTLSCIEFESLLDVGGGEGYKAALVRNIFNARVYSVDISAEACNRAKKIFDVDAEPMDIHKLPYNDEDFDVVLCSETLEHIIDINKATRELIRVARKAVIITVPHEPKSVIEENVRNNIPHAHIHNLDENSFDFAIPLLTGIKKKMFLNPFVKKIYFFAEASERENIKSYPVFVVNFYNILVPLLRSIFKQKTICFLFNVDEFIANCFQSHSGMIFVLIKDKDACFFQRKKKSLIKKVMDFKVPYYYMIK